jgi:hypothetical protein
MTAPPGPGRWYEWLVPPARAAGRRPWWRVPVLVVTVLVWLVVVLGPSVLAVRQASFFLLRPTGTVSARLVHCAQDSCQARYRVAGRSYTALGLPGNDGQQVSLAVDRDHPASWRTRGVAIYPVAAIAWLVVGLPGLLVARLGWRLRRAGGAPTR